VGDTVFFEISPQTYFVPFELPHAGADNRYASSYIEIMRKPAQRMLYGGFLWYHLAAMRESIRTKNKQLYRGHTIPWRQFLRSTFPALDKRGLLPVMKPYFAAFFESDKSKFPEKLPDFETYCAR